MLSLKRAGREGESSGWESSSSPVTMRIVDEDSRELLREWKMKNEPACVSVPTSTTAMCSLTGCPTEMTFVGVPFVPSYSDPGLLWGLWNGMGELLLPTNTGGDDSLDGVEMPLEKECLCEVSLKSLGGYSSSCTGKSDSSSPQTRTSMLLDLRI